MRWKVTAGLGNHANVLHEFLETIRTASAEYNTRAPSGQHPSRGVSDAPQSNWGASHSHARSYSQMTQPIPSQSYFK